MSTSVIQVDQSTTTIEVTGINSYIVQTRTPGNFPGYYGSFHDTTTQTNPVADIKRTVSLNTTNESYGCSIINGTRIAVAHAGVYDVQFSIVVAKSDGGTDTVDLWLSKNGNDIADSNTRVTLIGNGASQVLAWNYISTLVAGDYLELHWCSSDTAVSLPTTGPFTNPTRPRIPSVIVTIQQVRNIT